MRNVVLITIDSLRPDHCGFMGYHRDTTPTLDQMADDGLYFENAIVPGNNTPSSMKGIFTGTHLQVDTGFGEINKLRGRIRDEIRQERTLAEALSQEGYDTGAFTATAYASSHFGFDQGFDEFNDMIFENRSEVMSGVYERLFEKFTTGSDLAFALRAFIDFIQQNGAFMPWEKYYDQITKWVNQQSEPFFLWAFPLDAHHPYLAPRSYRQWSGASDMYLTNFYHNILMAKEQGEFDFSQSRRQGLIDAYDDSISYVDHFVKQLWEDLREYDPIFIIHADHGDAFGEHGFYGHQPYLYEEITHVPLIIYNAGIDGVRHDPVSLLGLAPAIFGLLDNPRRFPTKSLLADDQIPVSKIFEGGQKTAVRIGDWKYISGQQDSGELYNLSTDPGEQENLVSEYPGISELLQEAIESHSSDALEKHAIREGAATLDL